MFITNKYWYPTVSITLSNKNNKMGHEAKARVEQGGEYIGDFILFCRWRLDLSG